MVQVYKKTELEEAVEQEEVFIVTPEKIVTMEKKVEQKVHKKSKFFKKRKKTIDINNVKRNLDAKMYTNRFPMR